MYYFRISKMGPKELLLIVISGAGLLHALLVAVYLLLRKANVSNLILAVLSIIVAFRIAKSIGLYFVDGIETIYIMVGLTLLLAIGPLLRAYVRSMLWPTFVISKKLILEMLPFVLMLLAVMFFGVPLDNNDNLVIYQFAAMLGVVYLHMALYIVMSWREVVKVKAELEGPSKVQSDVMQWLFLLVLGFALIWISYVFNIMDESIPYIVGPLTYSCVVYYLTFKAFQLKITSQDGRVFKDNDRTEVYSDIQDLMKVEQLYLNPEMSLSSLSKRLNQSPQQTSSVINQYANKNFNDFVNYYRIQTAKGILKDPDKQKFTISSVAYEAGFSSLSTFNSAFKKFEHVTPSDFKKRHGG